MVWPPPAAATNRTNLDPVLDTHPADHNILAAGFNDTSDHILGTRSGVKAYTASGSIPNATWTRLTTATTEWKFGEGIRVDGNGIITDLGGFLLVDCMIHWSTSDGDGRRIVGISGSTSDAPVTNFRDEIPGVTNQHIQRAIFPWRVTAPTGTRVCLWGYQDSGATISLTTRKCTVMRLTHVF